MKLEEVLEEFRKGATIRRECWSEDAFVNNNINHGNLDNDIVLRWAFTADDWEIVPEKVKKYRVLYKIIDQGFVDYRSTEPDNKFKSKEDFLKMVNSVPRPFFKNFREKIEFHSLILETEEEFDE